MNSVDISIIIPIYNGEKFLEKCVCSLFEQTITDIEFIFVNDCTQDESITLIKKLIKIYPNRIPFLKIIHHRQNRGIAAARNTGIDNALGKYLFFIDQDDYLDNNALEIFYNKAKRKDADIVYSNYLRQYKHHCSICKNKQMLDKQSYLIEILEGKLPIELWSRLYRKELFDLHTLRFPENTSGVDDLAIIPVLFYYANRVEYINFSPYHYVRYNLKAETQQRMRKNRIESIVCAINYLENFFKEKDGIYTNALMWNKFHLKINCIQRTRGKLQQYVCSLFPEIEIDIKSCSVREKLIYYLSKIRFFTLLNFICDIKKLYNRLKGYI